MQETLPGALTPEELEERIQDVHVLGIRSKMQLRGGALQHAKKLLAVGCFCIGTNQVDLEVRPQATLPKQAANAAGIPVFNAPFSNTGSVASLEPDNLRCLSAS